MNWFNYKNKNEFDKVFLFIQKTEKFSFPCCEDIFLGYKYGFLSINEEEKENNKKELNYSTNNVSYLDE